VDAAVNSSWRGQWPPSSSSLSRCDVNTQDHRRRHVVRARRLKHDRSAAHQFSSSAGIIVSLPHLAHLLFTPAENDDFPDVASHRRRRRQAVFDADEPAHHQHQAGTTARSPDHAAQQDSAVGRGLPGAGIRVSARPRTSFHAADGRSHGSVARRQDGAQVPADLPADRSVGDHLGKTRQNSAFPRTPAGRLPLSERLRSTRAFSRHVVSCVYRRHH